MNVVVVMVFPAYSWYFLKSSKERWQKRAEGCPNVECALQTAAGWQASSVISSSVFLEGGTPSGLTRLKGEARPPVFFTHESPVFIATDYIPISKYILMQHLFFTPPLNHSNWPKRPQAITRNGHGLTRRLDDDNAQVSLDSGDVISGRSYLLCTSGLYRYKRQQGWNYCRPVAYFINWFLMIATRLRTN